MNGWIGFTDRQWVKFLSRQLAIEEDDFWQPWDKTPFCALKLGEVLLFKLHATLKRAVGGCLAANTIGSAIPALEAFGVTDAAHSAQQWNECNDQRRSKLARDGLQLAGGRQTISN